MDTIYLASVFTRRDGEDEVTLEEKMAGLEVRYGNLCVSFSPAKQHLALDKIDRA
jgi:hypothetical protein